MEAEDTLNKILHFQPKNWRDRQTLKRQLNSLEIDSETEDYFYRILFHSQPVQTELSSASESRNFPAIAAIAHPQYDNLKIYIGLIRTIQKSTIAELRTRSQICRSQSALSRLKLQRSIDFSFPNFVDAHQIDTALSCPVNFEDLGGWSE
ncbi:MAG: type IV pilin-like G/H family protein [Cyanobacteria bacterium P01_E01_bin.42]